VFAIPEAVIDDETGVLVAAGDASGLAAAMSALADDPARRARLAEHGRAHVIARFDERDAARIAWAHYASAAGW
jgi:glycosyltransferase involved in cell wall biosynthesis